MQVLQPHICRNINGLGYSASARRYWRNHYCFLFLRVLRCFSSPRLPSFRNIPINRDGLPHSDICGSIRLCRSPQLFAAWHVLLRLLEPRHPPYALVHLNSSDALLLASNVLYSKYINRSRFQYTLHCIFHSTCQRTFRHYLLMTSVKVLDLKKTVIL